MPNEINTRTISEKSDSIKAAATEFDRLFAAHAAKQAELAEAKEELETESGRLETKVKKVQKEADDAESQLNKARASLVGSMEEVCKIADEVKTIRPDITSDSTPADGG